MASSREPTWSAAEIAAHFRVTRKTVYQWAHRGILPMPVLVGGVSRWKDADVQGMTRRRGLRPSRGRAAE